MQEQKPFSHILKEELNKPPKEKTVEVKKFFYFEKLKGDTKAKWHEYKTNADGKLVLVE